MTTPRETHDLLWRLADKTLLSTRSSDFLLGILRWINGYHDGIRRDMSSAERSRVATKYGADYDERGAARHEAGIMFDATGAPTLTYALFADSLGDLDNYGGTHPACGHTRFSDGRCSTPSARSPTVRRGRGTPSGPSGRSTAADPDLAARPVSGPPAVR